MPQSSPFQRAGTCFLAKKIREQGIAASRARPSLFERMGDELTLPLALKNG
jgi:hypothetical protein